MLSRRMFCGGIALHLASPNAGQALDVAPILAESVEAGKIPGAVALVEEDKQTVLVESVGWRDLDRQAPMTVDTVFDIRSVTKPVTALAALLLVEDGKLALDGPVEEHLSEIAKLRARKPITLRHLLTHTSGLPHSRPAVLERLTERRDRPLAEVVSLYLSHMQNRLTAEPGAEWRYSSPAYAIAGRLVEVVSGNHLDKFIAERIFRPLGMRDSFFHPSDQARKRLAALYSWDKDGRRLESWPRALPERKWAYTAPGFGLYSTAKDVSRLLRSMFPSRSNLPSRVAEQMLEADVETEIAGLYQGLGWFVGKSDSLCKPLGIRHGCFGHNGAGGVMAWADPKRRRTAVYLQQVFFGPMDTGTRVTRAALCE